MLANTGQFRMKKAAVPAAFLLLFAALSAPCRGLEIPGAMEGVWLVDAVNDVSLAAFGLEVRVDDSKPVRQCVLKFLRSGQSAPVAGAREMNGGLELRWEFETTHGHRVLRLRGPVSGASWRGDYLFTDATGKRIGGGTFSARKVADAFDAEIETPPERDFAGVWIGHYGNQGERFRIRFELKRDNGVLSGAAVMPDEGIRAKVDEVGEDGDTVRLAASWEVPALDLKARVEFEGEWKGKDGWSGVYTVYPEGGRQGMAGGRFVARRPPGHASPRSGAMVIDTLDRPQANGLLEGAWHGFYRADGRQYGMRLEIGIVNERYAGAIFLPDDRMEATLFFASDENGVGVAMGSTEIIDPDGDPETLTMGLEGALQGNAWRGRYTVNSTRLEMDGTFRLERVGR